MVRGMRILVHLISTSMAVKNVLENSFWVKLGINKWFTHPVITKINSGSRAAKGKRKNDSILILWIWVSSVMAKLFTTLNFATLLCELKINKEQLNLKKLVCIEVNQNCQLLTKWN